MNRLQPGSTISYILMAVFICGFCLAASPATTPTVEQQRAALQAEFKDLSAEYKTQALTKENAELKMEKIAKRAGEVQEALKKLEPVKDGKGKK